MLGMNAARRSGKEEIRKTKENSKKERMKNNVRNQG